MALPILFALGRAPASLQGAGDAPILALLAALLAIGAWFAIGAWLRRRRAARADAKVHGDFEAFALAALANAAKLDGVVTGAEQEAIARAMSEAANSDFDPKRVEVALAHATLTKDELIAYVQERAALFSHDQKVLVLKALLSVFVADEHFDEGEHQALIDYTTALGFDRQSAPGQLRGLMSDLARGRMVT